MQDLGPHPRQLVFTTWCICHQYHLIVKNMLQVLDDHVTWSGEWGGTKYFSGLATWANVWRGVGTIKKVRDTCAKLFGETTSQNICGRMPGRVLRGRWGSIDEFERLVADGAGQWKHRP